MSQNRPNPRAQAILAQSIETSAAKIDRFFAGLFLFEWASRIALAYFRPAYDDALFTAIFIGAFVASVPSMLVVWKPGVQATRHAIAVAQMLYGALLVHLAKGTDSTHVHIIFSLAILALYRDPSVMVTGVAVGVLQAFALSDLHAASVQTMWLVCTGACLFYAALRGRADLATIAGHVANAETEARRSVPPVLAPTNNVVSISRPSPIPLPNLDCSILVVDDDLDVQKLLRDQLSRAGITVTLAPNGQVALTEVRAASEQGKPFDLVLMDMQMPVMDGFTATAELRKRGYGGPILALTGRKVKSDRRRGLDAGCTEFLSKPIASEALLRVVANHSLGSAATLPPPARKLEDALYSDLAEDEGEMTVLLDGFVARLHDNADEIENARLAGNTDDLIRLAHRLRGAAGSYGFVSISEAAARLEEAARSSGETHETHGTHETQEAAIELVTLCRRARARACARAFAQAAAA